MLAHDELLQFKQRLSQVTPLLKGIGSDSHWLALKPQVRSLYGELLARLSFDEMVGLTRWPVETWQRWMKQKIAVEDLHKRVRACRSGAKGVQLTNSALVRDEVLALCEIVPMADVIRELGVSRSTIGGWRRHSKPDASPNPRPQEEVLHLAEDSTAMQLKLALQRHAGKVRRQYSTSEKRRVLEMVDRFGSKAVHEFYGISYDTIARWRRRKAQGFEARRRTPLRYIPVVELMRSHPGMGPMQIRDYLRRHKGLSMSVASIRRVMEENGWVPPFSRIRRLPESAERYEAARRNYLWHLDFKHQWINRFKAYFFFIQDDYSRFIVGYSIVDGEQVDAVIDAINQAIGLHGRPEAIMSDGGSAFKSWRGTGRFTRFLEDYGIEQIIAKTPNVNGKLENLHQQLEKELLMPTQFASLQHCAEELSAWVRFYNFMRPHQGLPGTQAPVDRYYPGAKQGFESQSLGTHPVDELLAALSGLKKTS